MIRASSQRVWRLDEQPYPGAVFQILDRTFTILSVDESPGRTAKRLTIRGRCAVCGRAYTFKASKSRLGPVQTCPAHRGSRKPFRSRAAPAPAPVKPPYPTPPIPKIGERLSYGGENCTVTKVNPDGTAEVDFDDGTYEVVSYRKLRRRRA